MSYQEPWWWADPYGKEEEARLELEKRLAREAYYDTLDEAELQEVLGPWKS